MTVIYNTGNTNWYGSSTSTLSANDTSGWVYNAILPSSATRSSKDIERINELNKQIDFFVEKSKEIRQALADQSHFIEVAIQLRKLIFEKGGEGERQAFLCLGGYDGIVKEFCEHLDMILSQQHQVKKLEERLQAAVEEEKEIIRRREREKEQEKEEDLPEDRAGEEVSPEGDGQDAPRDDDERQSESSEGIAGRAGEGAGPEEEEPEPLAIDWSGLGRMFSDRFGSSED